MKTILFVPGFMEDLNTRDYKSVLGAIKKSGYKIKFVNISWRRTTIDDWVFELEEVYKNYDAKKTILAGFSFGAMTALVAASKRVPFELWLFSLSPYFSEDIPYLKLWSLRYIGKQRIENFGRLSFNKLALKTTCPTKIFMGEKEGDYIKHRATEANSRLKNSKLFVAAGTKHEVDNPGYIATIKANI